MSNNGTDQDDGFLGDAIKGAEGIKDVAAGAQRIPFDYSKIETEFLNGEHLDNPDGGPTVNIDAKAGDNKGSAAGEMEIIHFGRVYIDSEAKFAHEEYNDNDNIDMALITGARAGMHRAALMRELLLQAGYLHGIQWAMEEAGKTPPGNDADGLQMVDRLMGMVGDLVGGDTAGKLKASTLDLKPLIDQANAIGEQLNEPSASYVQLHQAGVDLHELRCKYRAFLKSQNESPPKSDEPPKGLLGGLPLIGPALTGIPVIGDLLKYGDKIMACSFQLVGRMTVEMHLKMEPTVNAAVREMSIDAIRSRRAPVFKPWWKYGPPPKQIQTGPSDDGGDGGLSIDLVKEAKKELQPTLNDIDDAVDEYTSFFQRPDKSTPGDDYIDMAFRIDSDGSLLDRAEEMAGYGSQVLCRTIDDKDDPFLPEIVGKIANYVFQLVTEFVRAVYKKLLSIGENLPDEATLAKEIAEAGRTHLLTSLIDWPLKEFGIDNYIDDGRFNDFSIPSVSGRDDVVIGIRPLFENVRELLIDQFGFMDAAVAFATKSFHELLVKVSSELTDRKTRGMEVYLALLPTLHATMFRNLLLPFWEAMQNAVKAALGKVLAPVMDQLGAGGFMGDIYDTVDTASQVAQRAKEAIDLFDSGINLTNLDKVEDLGRGMDDSGKAQAFDRGDATKVAKANPFGSRKMKVSAEEVSQADRNKAAPDLKWDPDADANETDPDADVDTEPPPSSKDANGGNS